MNSTYSCSYVEVLEILKHIPKEDYEKIPKEKIEFYKKNVDKNYVYIYDSIAPKTLRKTDAILINLYKNYIAKEDEKKKINEILKLNDIKDEQNKQKKFNSASIFNNRNIKSKNTDINSLEIVEYKETAFKRIINTIRKLLHIK